jgi:hypothetical protein
MFISRIFACLLVAAFLFCQVEAAAPAGVFVWYKANNNLLDFTANTSAAVLPSGAMQYAPGKVLDAFSFNGATALKINESPGSLNFGTGNFTIAAWVKFTAVSKAPVIYQNGYALNDSVLLYILTDGHARFFIRDGNANAITVNSTNSLNDNAWHYIVAVRSERSALLYIDGVLQACQTNPALGNINASCQFSWIGGTNTYTRCGSVPIDDRFFTGLIDEFFIVKRDLPGSEIANLYLNP